MRIPVIGFLLSLLVGAAAADHPFLPLKEEAAESDFTGEHWNDDWKEHQAPLAAHLSVRQLAEFPEGRVVEISLQTKGKPRHEQAFAPQQWLLTPDGSISRVDVGEQSAALEKWKASGHVPPPEPDDLLCPPQDESGYFTTVAESTEADVVKVHVTAQQWQWARQPWTTRVTTDDGSTVEFLSEHPSGHFSKIVWRRGVGILELAQGSGAGQSGWRLYRTLAPAQPLTDSTQDLPALFAALPAEFIPHADALTGLEVPAARVRLVKAKNATETKAALAALHADSWSSQPKNGYLKINSLGDGEGETLEAALWKRKDGSRLIGLHLQHWSAGPNHSVSVRLIELRNGQMRDVTTAQWPMPRLADFYREAKAANVPPGGLVEGDWSLPQKGTTIVIHPGKEDEADMLGPDVKSDEDFLIELRWDGQKFAQKQLPRKQRK